MRIFCETDTGKTRATNQDAYLAKLLENGVAFAVVCDGMGGANAGNVAAFSATKIIYDYVLRSWQSNMSDTQIKTLLCSAVMSANVEIYDAAVTDSNLRGMGTTVAAVLVTEKVTHIVHVGDSRVYLARAGELKQITTDHSVVQKLVDSGQLTVDEARLHPKKNIITRALGVDETVNVDYNEFETNKGDTVLICTDGLSNMVDTERMLDIINNESVENCAASLVSEANQNGGNDNITAVIISNS